MTTQFELTIDRLGAAGDGVARDSQGETRHVAGALPGERVRIAIEGTGGAELIAILDASPERTAPPCPHAEACGGCVFQHWDRAAQAAWKRERVVQALARQGIETEVAPTISAPLASRRRARLAARRARSGVAIGFHGRRSTRIETIERCMILRPAIVEALPSLARLARRAAPRDRAIGLWVLDSDSGLDIALEDAKPLDLDLRQDAALFAEEADIARLSWNGERIAERRPPMIRFGAAAVAPPPGGFLQATAEGEDILARYAIEALSGAGRVADLFCGAGAFALRLAERAEVLAVDGDAAAVSALDAGWRSAAGALRRVHALKRDLFRRPLLASEMKGLQGALFDPPRAGAEAQAAELAAAPFERLVGISCNPATFARDAAILARGGWRLRHVQPVDQFLFSAHVELAARFER